MRHYFLIGRNITNSFSPAIHNLLFKLKARTDCQYFISHDYQPPTVSYILITNFHGASITIPYKKHYTEGVLLNDYLTRKCGVINTLVKSKKDKDIGNVLKAYNTDINGIERCLYGAFTDIEYRRVLLIGAGATAYTFCHYFQALSIPITILNRNTDNAKSLQTRYNNLTNIFTFATAPTILQQHFHYHKYSIIVNTLPSYAVQSNYQFLHSCLQGLQTAYPSDYLQPLVYMTVNYREQIDVLKVALQRSGRFRMRCIAGKDMLVWQAVYQNALFCYQVVRAVEEAEWYFKRAKIDLNLSD